MLLSQHSTRPADPDQRLVVCAEAVLFFQRAQQLHKQYDVGAGLSEDHMTAMYSMPNSKLELGANLLELDASLSRSSSESSMHSQPSLQSCSSWGTMPGTSASSVHSLTSAGSATSEVSMSPSRDEPELAEAPLVATGAFTH